MDWGMRRTYIAILVESMEPKRKTAETTRRNSTLKYFLKKDDRRFQVCKKMFLATLGMREWQVRDWAQSSLDGSGMHETLNTKALPKRNR